MGRRDRERIARILAGEEAGRAERLKQRVVSALQRLPTAKQINVLADALAGGKLPVGRLKAELERNARREMRIGIERMRAKGEVPTVDALLEDYHQSKEFQALATSVGMDEQWFVDLAQEGIDYASQG